jgi:hypothetical protein
MLYQLKTGGTIMIDEALYFKLSDAEFEKYILYMRGSEINDPFHSSILDSDLLLFDEELDELPDLPDAEVDPKEYMSED